MNKGIIFLSLVSIIFSCAKIPQNVGKSRDIVVISSEIDSALITSNLQIHNYVPQKENLFTFIFAPDTAIERYNKFHTLILYGSLDDEFIRLLLNPDAENATRNDTFTLFKLNDLWARGQLAIVVAATSPDQITQAISKFRPLITDLLEENYYQRIKNTYYTKSMSKRIIKKLTTFGIHLDLDKHWMIDSTYKQDNFISVHAHFPDRSIFFYKEKLTNEPKEIYAQAKRDSLTKKYYKGDYILEDFTQSNKIEFKNMTGIRLRGVWQNDSLVAGGPFLSYFLHSKDTLYIIDGMLFNPGERKSDYFTMLEVIMNSLEIINPDDD